MFSEGGGSAPGFAQYLDASARLARYEDEADAWFREHPVALCPCAPDVAPPLGGRWPAELDGVPMRPGGKLTLATYASALGLPAVCVPVMRAEGTALPVGVQLIGARGSERSLLSLAAELEASLGGWLRPPD
jgi:Asp-tRNA(Asn)/Glu-tRNA(Gln) amidotransferase A subunit family amidase